MAKGNISGAQRALIKSCVEHGAAIEGLDGKGADYGPRFRYTPADVPRKLYKGKPSGRGSVKCADVKRGIKFRNWVPATISLDPNYNSPMKGDSPELTDARKAWHGGDPKPLRVYLASEAAERRAQAALLLL